MQRPIAWSRIASGVALITGLTIAPFALQAPSGATGAGPTWTQLSPGTSPSPRFLGAMAFDTATNTMMLFGGYDSSELVNDTWAWNGTNWTQLFPATSPPDLYYRSMTYDAANGTLVLFGGRDYSAAFHNETWTWDGTNWTEMSPATSPSPRAGSSMTYDPATGNVVLFGGYDANSSFLNDTWTWDGSNWTQMSPSTSPPPRDGGSMAYDSSTHDVVLFGGGNNDFYYNDTWTWDGSNWTQLSPAESPPALTASGFADYPGTGTMVLFAGSSYTASATGATWTWDGTTWSQQTITPSPTERWLPSMAYDPNTGNELLFGGITNGFAYLGDTWSYNAPITPQLTVGGITPNSGPVTGGTTVTITGTGFATNPGATTFDLGTAPATNVSCASSTQCTATNPAGSGTVDVTAVVGGITSAINQPSDQFTYADCPSSAKTNVRWHYSADDSSGGWSGTQTCANGQVTMGPQAMEGDLKVPVGDTFSVGYDLTMPGNNSSHSVSFTNAQVVFSNVECVSGASPTASSLTVRMPNQTYNVTNQSWYPSGAQSSPLVYQGSVTVPALCGTSSVRLQKGGTFSATINVS